MIRTAFAVAFAALTFVAVTGSSQAAPIAPVAGASNNITQVDWHGRHWHHRHWHHRHWRHWCWHHPRAC